MRCLLVDKITAWEKGSRITGVKNVTMSENFLQDHFPGFPVMPGVMQLEAVAQLGSWLVFASSDYRHRARLAGAKSITYKDFVVPGDQMRIELELVSFDEQAAGFTAEIFVGDTLKTRIKGGRLALVAAEQLEDTKTAQQHFQFITGNAPMGAYTSGSNGSM
ncbi:MAG: beta-hydroxyacyl-ACP dehydratase [Deltaproteobacteria bacterium]|nr:beta-hydroxyacyl-ACP dehydratase [Deltaproteobacteria bacterium]